MNDDSGMAALNASVDEKTFRRACAKFATGITIITTRDQQGQPVGLTANSFTSCSLSPPLVLWTVGPQSRSFESFLNASHYAVHILHRDQRDLAAHFAGKSDNKFAGLDWSDGMNGLPILPEFSVCMECAVEDVHPCGNQKLMIGRVVGVRNQNKDNALLYFESDFRYLDSP